MQIIQSLMLVMLAGQFSVDVVPSFSVDVKTKTVAKTRREWYLVSEPWCSNCPAAKDRFKSLGWPESNILTIEQCYARFGFRPDHVPFEFGEPLATNTRTETKETVRTNVKTDHMSHGEMVRLHNQLHGGGSWTWTGDLATHLQTVHGVSTGTTTSTTRATTVQRSTSYCPGGNCPTGRTMRRTGFLRVLFR